MTQLQLEPYRLPGSPVGTENPLPHFRDRSPDSSIRFGAFLPFDERTYKGWRTGFRVLPYRMQDDYTRARRPMEFPGVVLENEHLRATFLPSVGGKLMSLVHKPSSRELLDRNPVFQPANLALRNAWTSGGIEWNAGQLGHHYLTCAPMYAARVRGTQGDPVLRIYEFDRVKGFVYQLDFHLPPQSEFLFARVRIVNPNAHEIPMYWWTNIAVPETEHTRVLVPAEEAVRFNVEKGLELAHMPELDGFDASYPLRAPRACEYFFRILENQRRWVAAVEQDGRGFIQASTSRLMGRKLFCWGAGPGGRHWQEFLAAPGRAYIEIQAGLARTQLESLPMPANTEWTWTEAFGAVELAPSRVQAAPWTQAWNEAQANLDRRLPQARLDEYETAFGLIARQPAEEQIFAGSAWGALENCRRAKAQLPPLPKELLFPESALGGEQRFWLALAQTGALPEPAPQDDPGAYMGDEWRTMLEQSVTMPQGAHWASWLHLGVMRHEALDFDGARAAWSESLKWAPNAWALRNLAMMEAHDRRFGTAADLMEMAWNLGPQIAPLAIECAQMLLNAGRAAETRRFIAGLPEQLRTHERLRMIAARAGFDCVPLAELEPELNALFATEVASIREGEASLSDIWFELQERKLAAKEGLPIDEALRKRVRKEYPPPKHIDFR